MDGLLIDSEPLWHEAEIEILGALGVPLEPANCRQTKGMFVNEVTRYWYGRFPWVGPDPDQVAVAVVDRVLDLVLTQGELKPGVSDALALCARHDLGMALASGSEYRLIDAVLDRFDLRAYFPIICSAEDETFGKPHPGVFLTTAARLGVAPERCVVWEDSPAGVLAAKAARMACIAVPEIVERNHPNFAIADLVLDSLSQMDEVSWARLGRIHEFDPSGAPPAVPPGG